MRADGERSIVGRFSSLTIDLFAFHHFASPLAESRIPNPDRSFLPRNVWVLGWVSLFNDTATEMSYWLLPQFLVGALGAGPMAFGLMEGAAATASSLARLVSGFLSDRLARRKPLTAAGYTAANLTKPLLALAQTWHQVSWIRFVDRAAKASVARPATPYGRTPSRPVSAEPLLGCGRRWIRREQSLGL